MIPEPDNGAIVATEDLVYVWERNDELADKRGAPPGYRWRSVRGGTTWCTWSGVATGVDTDDDRLIRLDRGPALTDDHPDPAEWREQDETMWGDDDGPR